MPSCAERHISRKNAKSFWTKIKENVLAHGKKICRVDIQYADVQILKPVWTYSIQLWGFTKRNNTDIIQGCQNKVLRNIVDAPWYIRNVDLHRNFQMEMVTNETGEFAKKHEERLLHYVKSKAIPLLNNTELVRRLKRKKRFELL